MSSITAILMLIGGIAAIVFVVYMERAQRRITVNYARRQQGRKMMQAQSTHLPFKINMAGVIPPIFASSILMFPATIAQFFGQAANPTVVQQTLQKIGANLGPGQPVYVLMYAALIIFFCFFYTALQYNSKETADQLKKGGAFLPGIRPGAHTAEYIDRVLTRLTFWGALYIAGVCLLPELVRMFYPTHVLPEHAVQFWRHKLADSGRGHDGLHVANAGTCNESSVRRHDAESQPAQLRPGRTNSLIRQRFGDSS
jgi:preprotein translocase subunit SecY